MKHISVQRKIHSNTLFFILPRRTTEDETKKVGNLFVYIENKTLENNPAEYIQIKGKNVKVVLETDKEMMKEKIRGLRDDREGEKGGELRVILGLRNDDERRW